MTQFSLFIKVREVIRDCFVTGKWKESEDAAELLQLDDESSEEVFGDFEDLETGEKHTSKTESNSKEENVKGTLEGKEMVQNGCNIFIKL
jgi:ribosome biogenesis protein BMS1